MFVVQVAILFYIILEKFAICKLIIAFLYKSLLMEFLKTKLNKFI